MPFLNLQTPNYGQILYGDKSRPTFGVETPTQNNSLFYADSFKPPVNPATIPKTQQTQPAQAPSTSDVPATNNQNSLTNAIDNLKNAQGNLNNYKNNTQLLNSQDLAKNTLPVLPDRNQFDNTSLLKFENVKPENWTPQQWGWLGDVYAAKTAYETHTKNIDWYNNQLARTDLSDADRQKYTNARDTAMQLRENAMNSGAMTRRTALANGFDIDALGMSALGDSLGATTQALDYFQQRNQQSLLKLPTPRAFNRQRRDELKKEGYNPFHALVLANEETKDYVDDASNKLLWAMQMNGTTDGVINNNGVGYLKQLLKIDPASANMFAQEYASPAQGFAAQNQTLNNILNNDNALQRLLLNIAAQDRHQDKDIAKSFGLLTQQQTWQGEQNNANREISWANIGLKEKQLALNAEKAANELVLKNQEAWNKSPEGKVYQATMLGRYLGYEGKDLEDFVMAQFTQAPNADKRQVAYNEFDSTSKDIEKLIKDGEFEKAKESINSLNDRIRDFNSDFKYVSLDDREIWASMLDIYTNAANRQYKPGEFDKLMYDFKHRTKSPAGNGDAYMAELMNNPDRVKGIYEQYKKWNIPTFKGNMAEQILKFREYSPYAGSSLASTGNTQVLTGYERP